MSKIKAKSKGKSKGKSKAKTMPKTKIKTKTRAKSKSKTKTKTKAKTRSRAKTNKQLFHLIPGVLEKYGYHGIKDLTQRQRHGALNRALSDIRPLSLFRRLNALYVLNKNQDPGVAGLFRKDRDYVKTTRAYATRDTVSGSLSRGKSKSKSKSKKSKSKKSKSKKSKSKKSKSKSKNHN